VCCSPAPAPYSDQPPIKHGECDAPALGCLPASLQVERLALADNATFTAFNARYPQPQARRLQCPRQPVLPQLASSQQQLVPHLPGRVARSAIVAFDCRTRLPYQPPPTMPPSI
jgi:hypothetical protein